MLDRGIVMHECTHIFTMTLLLSSIRVARLDVPVFIFTKVFRTPSCWAEMSITVHGLSNVACATSILLSRVLADYCRMKTRLAVYAAQS